MTFNFRWYSFLSDIPFWVTYHFECHSILSDFQFWVTSNYEWHIILSGSQFWVTCHFKWHSILSDIPFGVTFNFQWNSILSDIWERRNQAGQIITLFKKSPHKSSSFRREGISKLLGGCHYLWVVRVHWNKVLTISKKDQTSQVLWKTVRITFNASLSSNRGETELNQNLRVQHTQLKKSRKGETKHLETDAVSITNTKISS